TLFTLPISQALYIVLLRPLHPIELLLRLNRLGAVRRIRPDHVLERFARAIRLSEIDEHDAFAHVRFGERAVARIIANRFVERLERLGLVAGHVVGLADLDLRVGGAIGLRKIPQIRFEALNREIVLAERVVPPGHVPELCGRRAGRKWWRSRRRGARFSGARTRAFL